MDGSEDSTARARALAGLIAAVTATAIMAQLGLNLARAAAQGAPLWRVPIDLFGYFTIWSNTLVAVVTGWFAIRGDEKKLLGRPWLRAAAAVYIGVVGLIYHMLLARYNPQVGVRLFLDQIFHSVIPIAYPLWWWALTPRGRLGWNALLPALAFPMAYSVVAIAKGAMTGKYAYFFIDIGKYGVPQVLLNIAGLALLFALLMAVVIAFDRRVGRAAPDPAG